MNERNSVDTLALRIRNCFRLSRETMPISTNIFTKMVFKNHDKIAGAARRNVWRSAPPFETARVLERKQLRQLELYDSSSRSSSRSCRWTRGSLRFNSTSHPGGKLGKLQLNNRRPTCLLLASLRPSRYNMEQNYTPRFNSAACLGLISCIGA